MNKRKLTILKKIKEDKSSYYICECACGNIVILTEEEIIGEGCGAACLSSRGELCAADVFNDLNVKYQVQKKFDDFDLRFDFFLPDYNIVIECDGAQHFRSINNEWDSKFKLQETRDRDIRKQEYCKKKGIKLFQIPFWDYARLSREYLKSEIEKRGSNENSN